MRSLMTALGLLALLAVGPVGCGDSKRGDNSNIQTPNDQPIGAPKGLGSDAKPGQLGAPAKSGDKKANKPLPAVEIKR